MSTNNNNPAKLREMLKDPIHCFSFGFASGLLPFASGTWGTIMSLPFFSIMHCFNNETYLLILLALILFSIYACDYTSAALGEHDHKAIVCDEIVGYLLVLFFIPVTPLWFSFSFVVFRFFDIFKPWPIAWLDKNIKHGFGIVIDDIAAAIFTLIAILPLLIFS